MDDHTAGDLDELLLQLAAEQTELALPANALHEAEADDAEPDDELELDLESGERAALDTEGLWGPRQLESPARIGPCRLLRSGCWTS